MYDMDGLGVDPPKSIDATPLEVFAAGAVLGGWAPTPVLGELLRWTGKKSG